MKNKALIVVSFACSLAAAAVAQQNCITIPAGEFRLVPCPFTVSDPSGLIHIGPLPSLSVLTWNGSAFDENRYSSLGEWDFPPSCIGSGYAVVLHPIGGPVTICFPEPTQSPTLPLLLGYGFNLVCCQSNVVAGFDEIVGRPPWEGVQVYRLNPGLGRNPSHFGPPDYGVYTFSGGAWTPGVPMADALEGVFVYQPAPSLLNIQVANGSVRFDVSAPPGRTVIVEYVNEWPTTGLPAVWNEVTTLTAGGSLQPVTDQVGQRSQRFYRVRSQ